ncbi:MAG TPA: iron ABC transporter permease [Aggregatilinea sp.]|uniref:FecCD family ABC transporter permease n=1 Tax=Aggregatilinea sp. TaxID=2806333 RepID=UPI002CDDDDF0|nr:iron ABC transporter permease [Aggregatilinea sp.]HML20302.1 iron ABC transporter permease [Aggregatilinea sp.]
MAVQVKQAHSNTTRLLGRRSLLLPGLAVAAGLLVLCLVWSITLGAADIKPETVFNALLHYDSTQFEHLIIRTVRLPRVLSGVVVGAGLAAAGAIMQGLTRNPLADSGILGINAGAAFAVVMSVYLIGDPPMSIYALAALIGAAAAALIVYGLGSLGRGGATPLRLTLAGVILTSFVSSLTTAILIQDQETLDKIRFWTAGSLAGRDMELLRQMTPIVLAGLVGSVLISRQITTISLGEDVAKGLGQNTLLVKAVAAVMVVLLAGGSVALAGPIGFVGLIVPHVARFVVGVDYRWIIPSSMILGGILITVADVAARLVLRPQELPVGIMMAVLGAPFFIFLARWKVRR